MPTTSAQKTFNRFQTIREEFRTIFCNKDIFKKSILYRVNVRENFNKGFSIFYSTTPLYESGFFFNGSGNISRYIMALEVMFNDLFCLSGGIWVESNPFSIGGFFKTESLREPI